MSRLRTRLRKEIAAAFVCLLLLPATSFADNGIFQGIWARVEALVQTFVAPGLLTADRPGERVAVQTKSQDTSETDYDDVPPPSRHLVHINPGG